MAGLSVKKEKAIIYAHTHKCTYAQTHTHTHGKIQPPPQTKTKKNENLKCKNKPRTFTPFHGFQELVEMVVSQLA
jgi:hypothetical protein